MEMGVAIGCWICGCCSLVLEACIELVACVRAAHMVDDYNPWASSRAVWCELVVTE